METKHHFTTQQENHMACNYSPNLLPTNFNCDCNFITLSLHFSLNDN